MKYGGIVYEWTYELQVSHKVRSGDKVSCTISELQPLKAEPEDIPLNIVYEDDHVLVVNKPAHMVRFSILCCYEASVVCIWTPETFYMHIMCAPTSDLVPNMHTRR